MSGCEWRQKTLSNREGPEEEEETKVGEVESKEVENIQGYKTDKWTQGHWEGSERIEEIHEGTSVSKEGEVESEQLEKGQRGKKTQRCEEESGEDRKTEEGATGPGNEEVE